MHPSTGLQALEAWIRSGMLAMVLLAFCPFARAQDSRFQFDANGNLLLQTSATSALPEIVSQPQTLVVAPGEIASFFVVAADSRGLSYRWRFNGTNINSANTDVLTLNNAGTTNEGLYSVVLSNSFGSVTSAPAMLWIDTDDDGLGDSWESNYFGNLSQTATGDFDGDGIPNLDEFLNGTNPTNALTGVFTLTVSSDGGLIQVVPVQDSYTNGQVVTLTATPNPPDTFHAWTGDALTRSNVISLVMTNNKSVFAHFSAMDFLWTNGVGGDWQVAANWQPNLVPASNDNVTVNIGPIITLNSDAACADFNFGAANITPTLDGTGTLTIFGNATWIAGAMSGTGRTVLETGSTLTIANPGPVYLWSRTLENGGTVVWSGPGDILDYSGTVVSNRSGGLFIVQNSGLFSGSIGIAPRFDNAGTVRKSDVGATSTFGIALNNFWTVDVHVGALVLAGGGINSGTMTFPAGTALNLAGATFTANASSSITGAGDLTISGGVANLGGLVNMGGTYTITGGGVVANFTGTVFCTNNILNIPGGSATFSGAGTVSPSVLNLTGGILDGSMAVTVGGGMIWTAGAMTGSGRTIIPPGIALAISNQDSIFMESRTLENGGTITWSGTGNMGISAGAVITNRAGALISMSNSIIINGAPGTPPRIDNAGTFRKSVSSGTTTFGFGLALNNYGTVEILSGTLFPASGGYNSGSITLANATTLILSGGTFTGVNGSSITGSGDLIFSGGEIDLGGSVNVSGNWTVNMTTGAAVANLTGTMFCTNNTLSIINGTVNFSGAGAVTPAVVNLTGGTLDGNMTVTVGNTMSWTAGAMTGIGRTIIAPGAALTVTTANGVYLATRTLENAGTTTWASGANYFFLAAGAVITNRAGALFDVQTSTLFQGAPGAPPRFDNAGILRKSAGSGITGFGFGTTLNNYGSIEILSGIIAAYSGYTSSSNAFLNCAIGGTTPGAGYGQLQIGGTAALNGALSVDLINGFVPMTNSTFTVLTADSRNGTFNNFLYPSNAVTMQLSNTPDSVVVRVTDVFIVPQSAPLPAGLISWWRAEGNASDSAGTNHGVLTNGATFAAGQIGQTFALDGVNDFVQVPDSPSLRPASVTIEAWVKFFATNGIRIVLVKPLGNNTSFDSYGLALQDGAVVGAICDNSGFGPFLTGPANTVTGQWYHLAYTFDDTSKQQALYVNGVPVASGTANKTISYDTHPVLLGVDLENGVLSFFHNGLIDEATLYNRALTRDEIATIYNAGAAGKQLGGGIPPPLLLPPEISGTNFKLTWTTVSNTIYRVEFNPNLVPSNWVALPGDITAVSNTASKQDFLTTSNRLYRVRVLP